MTAQEAMHELWGTACPDCGPDDYAAIVKAIVPMLRGNACRHLRRVLYEPASSLGDESDYNSRCADCGALLRQEPNR